MQGLEMIKNLAVLDQELAEKVEEARRMADRRIKHAESEAQRLLAEAEAQIHQMEEASRTRLAQEGASLSADAHKRATAEKDQLRRQALPNLDRAMALVLSEVLP
jgi:V/A-type H+-transporting ATPase subunit G/H